MHPLIELAWKRESSYRERELFVSLIVRSSTQPSSLVTPCPARCVLQLTRHCELWLTLSPAAPHPAVKAHHLLLVLALHQAPLVHRSLGQAQALAPRPQATRQALQEGHPQGARRRRARPPRRRPRRSPGGARGTRQGALSFSCTSQLTELTPATVPRRTRRSSRRRRRPRSSHEEATRSRSRWTRSLTCSAQHD